MKTILFKSGITQPTRETVTPPYRSAAAFAGLFDRTHPVIYRYVWARGGGLLSTQEVEDITAETFFRAWRSRERFHGDEGAAVGWLLQIARNLVTDSYRRRSPVQIEDADQFPETSDTEASDDPEIGLLDDEQIRTLWATIAALPDDQRELVALRYVLGWRVNQIAAHLSLPANTVSVKLRRILHRLRTKLTPKGIEGEFNE